MYFPFLLRIQVIVHGYSHFSKDYNNIIHDITHYRNNVGTANTLGPASYIILYISHFGSVEPDGLRAIKPLFNYRRTLISVESGVIYTLFKLPVASVQDYCVLHPNPVGEYTCSAFTYHVHMPCSGMYSCRSSCRGMAISW